VIITPVYAGLLALWFLVLSCRVDGQRASGNSDPELRRRVRAQENFSKFVPIVLLLIGILELGHFPALVLHALGTTLLLARLLHGYSASFQSSSKFGCHWGNRLTLALLFVCGVLCVYQGISSRLPF